MQIDRQGSTTIEALVALIVFAVGALGAAGTVLASLRGAYAGTQADRAARLVSGVVDHLADLAAAAGGRCAGLVAGADSDSHGGVVRWDFLPSESGRDVRLDISYRTSSRQHVDSAWYFVRCR